jgi:hypothetical protein
LLRIADCQYQSRQKLVQGEIIQLGGIMHLHGHVSCKVEKEQNTDDTDSTDFYAGKWNNSDTYSIPGD